MFPKSFLEEQRQIIEEETKKSNPNLHKIRMDYEVLNKLKEKFQNLSIEEKNKYIQMDLDKGLKTLPLIETKKPAISEESNDNSQEKEETNNETQEKEETNNETQEKEETNNETQEKEETNNETQEKEELNNTTPEKEELNNETQEKEESNNKTQEKEELNNSQEKQELNNNTLEKDESKSTKKRIKKKVYSPSNPNPKIVEALEEFLNQGFDPNEEDMCTEIVILHKGKEHFAGKIRILKNKQNSRVRVLMRTNQYNKILLNHYTNPDIDLKITELTVEYGTTDFSDLSKPELINIILEFPRSRQDHVQIFYDKFKEGQEINKKLLSQQ